MSNDSTSAENPSVNEAPPTPPGWLEPPEWWQKWRPLRWLAAIAVLVGLYSWLGPALRTQPAEQARLGELQVAEAASATPAASESGEAPAAVEALAQTADETAPDEPELIEESVYYEEAAPIASDSELAAFTRVEPDPVPLLGGIYRSYMEVDGIVRALEVSGLDPVVESRHSKVAAGVPPRDLDVVTVRAYRHWDVPGRMELQFFNDRLYQAEFEPEDAEAYRAAQRRELPQLKRERAGRSELIDGDLRIASSLDLSVSEVGRKLQTRPFLLWQDRRLVRLRDEWDRRFGLPATP